MTNVKLAIIREQVDLKEYNWFGVGGLARYFSEPKTLEELKKALSWAKNKNLSVRVIGQGANVLIADEGVFGLVIKLPSSAKASKDYDHECGLLTVSAGNSLEETIIYMLREAKLIGLEEFSGIPSSIGGALFINIHYFQFLIAQFVFEATVYDMKNEIIKTVDRDWFRFGYDDSMLKRDKNFILIDATFKLKKATELEIAFAEGRSLEIIRHRKSRFPYEKTCGCFFKNFLPDDVGLGVTAEGKKILAAGYYLDQIGIKGSLKRGHSFVSSKHANMITHDGLGKASEIIEIAKIMQQEVFKKFGLFLEPECELIGFSKNPLYSKKELLSL
jgi:UDP-N-acetylmuramate dehydrogenase